MLKQFLSLALVALLFSSAGMRVSYAKSEAEKRAQLAEKVKSSVLSLGTGEAARVKVKLRDKTKLEGYISVAGAETFAVTDAKTGVVSTIAYSQVKSIKGNNLSTGAKIAIGVGVAALVIFLIFWKVVVDDD